MSLEYAQGFSYVSTDGSNLSEVKRALELPEAVEAPVEEGTSVGRVVYLLNEKEIGSSPIITAGSVEKAGYGDYFLKTIEIFLL